MSTRKTQAATKLPRPSAAAKARAKAKAEDATIVSPAGPDLRAMLEKLRLPGLDAAWLLDSRRKDVKALIEANQRAYSGFEAVVRRQGEMLAKAMKQLESDTRETFEAQGAGERAGVVSRQAQKAFGQALADMKELAELSVSSNKLVLQALGQRLREGVEESRQRLAPKR